MQNNTLNEVLKQLQELAQPEKVLFKQEKFGVIANNAIGVYHKDLKILAKKIGKNSDLANQLFNTNIYEARLLCSKIYDPKDLTEKVLEKWVKTFENWEIVDSFCMALVAKSSYALPKILEWTQRENEFEKRAGFTTMAAFCMADKKASNKTFIAFLPIIEAHAFDKRIYVKKAVNWALRSIGKRNKDLKTEAIKTAKRILKQETKAAHWIANNALKELENNPRQSDYPRHIYRKQ